MKEETLRSMESAGQREDAEPGLKIPRPTFIVLYNGTEEIPDTIHMQLSDNFRGEGKNDLQLHLTVYNINEGKNQEIMEHCKTLQEYSLFVAKMRRQIRRTKGPLTEKELGSLLKECVEEGILTDFLKTYGTEVISMLFTEMTEEEARDLAREDGYEYGYEEGLKDEKKRIVRNMKAKGIPINDIAEVTGLTAQEIKEL